MAYNNIDINLKASLESKEKEGLRQPSKSLKSIRTYQLGVVYKDKHGRETPVFTSQDATFTVPKRLCEKQNSIVANIFNEAPDWADSYKFFVKETSNEYYNICMDRFYESADGNVWLSFPSAERNKIKEDSYIILKKQPGKDASAVLDEARYRIIDVQNEAPEFIKVDYEVLGIDTIRLLDDGAMPGTKTIKMDGDHSSNDFEDSIFFDAQQVGSTNKSGNNIGFITGTDFSDIAVRIQSATEKTNFIDVAAIVKVSSDYHIKLSNVLPGEKLEDIPNLKPVTIAGINAIVKPKADFTGQDAQDVQLAFAKKVLKNNSEFEGRFFVKIKRDEALNANIAQASLNAIQPRVLRSMPIGHARPQRSDGKLGFDSHSQQKNYFGTMRGGQFFIDEINRSRHFEKKSDRREKDNGFGIRGDEAGSRTNTNNSRTDQAAWLQCSMELTLSKVANNKDSKFDMTQQSANDRDFYESMRSPGTYFRFKEDPYQIIYMVSPNNRDSNDGSHGVGLFNYSKKDDLDRSKNKSNRIYLKCVAVGWRLENDQGYYHFENETKKYIFDESIEGKHPWFYRNKDSSGNVAVTGFTPPTEIQTADNGATSAIIDPGPWNPTLRGYGAYGSTPSNNLHTATSSGYGIITQIGNGAYSRDDDSNIYNVNGSVVHNHIEILELTPPDDGEVKFDPNPAIWETEPKEAIDLDIYYEASQAYPTKLTNKTNELLIPYGSKVECVDAVEVTSGTDLGNKRLYLPENTYVEDWAPTGHGGDTILLNIEPSQLGYVDLDKTIEDTVNIGTDTFDNQTNEFLITPNSSNNPILPLHGANVFNYINNYFTDQVITGVNTTRGKAIKLKFTRPDGSHITLPVQYFSIWRSTDNFVDGFNPTISASQNTGYHVLIKLKNDLSKNIEIKLPYFNCYSFGNGVESDRIRDDFNAIRLDKGVKASSVIAEPYIEEQRTNGLIYSGIYNSNSNKNDLNQFIAGESITKDINTTYGSIQKLYQKDPYLITFCEDKVLKITAGKDTLFNAGGNTQLVSSNKVLGDASAYQGEYGISKNPESFAFESFRTYFTDKQRGKVLRLSSDGITEISNAGMRYYFEQNLKTAEALIGTFDDRKQEYNLTIKQNNKASSGAGDLYLNSVTVSFSEFAKGWVSFKSFIPENGLSMNNDYYTFKRGDLYKHHSNSTRNNFYNQQFDSHVDVIFNQSSESVKNFRSMKYEGSQSRITENLSDKKYFNNVAKTGWYVDYGSTDLEKIGQMEFKNKEGKWFSSIKGVEVKGVSGLNSKEFSFQGIDFSKSVKVISEPPPPGVEIFGCTDPLAENYNPNATTDDGSCDYIPVIPGCMEPAAANYNPEATVDDGSCIVTPIIYGCTDEEALNYDPNATVDDGSCQLQLTYGCTDPKALNYDPTADIDDGSCIYEITPTEIPGCTNPEASNYNPAATIDDGSCEYKSQFTCDANYYPIVEKIDFDNSGNYMDSSDGFANPNIPTPLITNGGPAPYGDGMSTVSFTIKIPKFNTTTDAYSWEIFNASGSAERWSDNNIYIGYDFFTNNPQITLTNSNTISNSQTGDIKTYRGRVILTDGGYANRGDTFQFLPFPLPSSKVGSVITYNAADLKTCVSHITAVAPHNDPNRVAAVYSTTTRSFVKSTDTSMPGNFNKQKLWSGDYVLRVSHFTNFFLLASFRSTCYYTENFTIGCAAAGDYPAVENKVSLPSDELLTYYEDPTKSQVGGIAPPQPTTGTLTQDQIEALAALNSQLEELLDNKAALQASGASQAAIAEINEQIQAIRDQIAAIQEGIQNITNNGLIYQPTIVQNNNNNYNIQE